MASSLVRPGQRATSDNVPASGTSGKHPVLIDYEAALERGDPRAKMASEILSGSGGQPLQRVALNMLKQRGLSPEAVAHRLGLM